MSWAPCGHISLTTRGMRCVRTRAWTTSHRVMHAYSARVHTNVYKSSSYLPFHVAITGLGICVHTHEDTGDTYNMRAAT